MIKFNINHDIYIQITQDGWKHLRKNETEEYIKHCIQSRLVKINGEDWYKLQCWDVFNIFPVTMGRPLLVETTVLIENR